MTPRLYITLIFNAINYFSFSQTEVNITNQELDLTPSIHYFVESDTHLTLNRSLELLKTGKFKESKEKRCLNFGAHSNPVWIYISLESKDDVEKILHYACAYIYYLDVYEKNNNNDWTILSNTGKKRPFSQRGDLHPTDYAWNVFFKKDQKKKLLLRIEARSPLLIPLTLESVDNYTDIRSTEFFIYGLYFGILIIMLFYNLFVYISLKERTYLYYILSILCTIMIFSSSNGFSAKYLFPNWWQINYFLSETFMCLILLPTSMFAITFLELKKYSKFAYYLMKSLAIISFPSTVFVIVFEHSLYASFIVAILAVSLLTVGIITLFKKNPYARYYVIAWFAYLTGGLFVTLRNLGHLPSTFITDNGAEIGSAFEVCLLAFALADKYKKIREEKKQLKIQHLKLVENQKEDLEKLVKERTTKLVETVEELNTTLTHLNEQQIELEQKNNHITSSINYALKIQQSILPDEELLNDRFLDYMQLYLPKDIVSGDFIFYLEDEGLKYYAIADCTGHGVPGAILGMLGYNILYEIIKVHHYKNSNEILAELDRKLTDRLSQNKSGMEDGMDISLVIVDETNSKVYFSGAVNPILIVNKDESSILLKGSKRSISDKHRSNTSFCKHVLDLKEISWIYLYSDGFQDQFGQEMGTKYFSKRLREFLISNSKLSGSEQSTLLKDEFLSWKGNEIQIDDISVAGIKISE